MNSATGAPLVNRSSLPKGFTPEQEARKLVLEGDAAQDLWTGTLKFEQEPNLTSLPNGLTVMRLEIRNCPNFQSLPENLWAETIRIQNCPAFREIPSGTAIEQLEISSCDQEIAFGRDISLGSLRLTNCSAQLKFRDWLLCRRLTWNQSPLEDLPKGVRVSELLDLSGSGCLRRLPERMTVDSLILQQCTALEKLPDRLEARVIDLSGCTRLRWQDDAFVEVSELNLAGCVQITGLPWWLVVQGAIDVANTGLAEMPESCSTSRLLWRGVEVTARIAFHPQQIKVEEILAQRNSELRRVMLERMGWEKFFHQAKPKVRDRDFDPGGERRLLHICFPDREDLLVLCVSCPSTGRRYFIRVPPQVRTCHQAAAWIAGFDDPKEYEPVRET